MREIKFRYTCVRENRYVFSRIFTIEQIESGEVRQWWEMNHVGKIQIRKDQYIGLKDRNGNEIYEGDIVQDKVNNCIWRYVIQSISFMGNNLFAVCIWRNFTVIDGETIMGDYSVKDGNWNYLSSTLEVIGNIYENPELLKETP